MTIYFAGSEPDCLSGTFIVDASGSYHDNNYVRCGLRIPNPGSVVATLESAATSGAWIHFRTRCGSSMNTNVHDRAELIEVLDSSGNPVIETTSAVDAAFVFTVYNAAGGSATTTSASAGFVPSSAKTLDFHYYLDGENVNLDWYVDAVLTGSASVAGSLRDIKTITFGSTNGYVDDRAVYSLHISEIIVASYDTRYLRVGCYYPSADGTHTDGTGGYADLDEIETDANAVTLSSVGNAQSVQLTKHGTQPYPGVLAIAVNGLVASGGTNDLQAGLRIDGEDYYSANLGVGTTPEARSIVWSTNPAGGQLPQDPSQIELIWKVVA